MNKKYLFSPLGGTDPISQSNYKDGSMLHICRFEKPDKVYLYLSKEMVEYEQQDNRYSYCLNKLMELQNRTFEVEMIENPELVDVQSFDFFYPEFSRVINKIMREEMDETDTLILNISSGTPAMKSALAVLKTISEVSCRLIQVTTPTKSINKHDNSGYDPVLMWEYNEDNLPDTENRCCDVSLPSLALLKKEEIIKMHIRAYDYRAALQVAESLPVNATVKYLDFLRMSVARINYNLNALTQIERKTAYQLPVKSSNAFKRFEYALVLHVKLQRGEYADFIRAITPLIVDLYEQVLKTKCDFVVDDYCTPANKLTNQPRRWSRRKLDGTDVLQVLEGNYNGEFKYGPVYSDQLKALINDRSNDQGLKNIVNRLRDVESNVRNLAAHELDSFDDSKIQSLTGYSANTILQNIKSLFGYTGYNIPKEAWNSYEEMNDFIIDAI